ncbi:atypical chemokine receptor 3b [Esox lucius]|uniref:G-protein coupled receptors family 1 profile domain-containing protein n=1 Tax=Esox lucius TaxID=8010 RepID=A0A3P8ZDW7_ESOLU|nr:atypical chemokine receptor 3b [Esox lucius]
MSLSVNDLTELMEIWEELNFTADQYGDNLSTHHVEALLCPPAFSHGAVLYTLSVLYIFIFLVGLAANSLVVWVNLRSKAKRYETHLYILNLAVADLCVVATLPVWVSSLLQRGHWPFGEAVCKITHLVFSVNLFGSIFFLTCMSVDRYLSVALFREGGNGRRKKVVRRVICILIWLLSVAASVPDTYFLQAVKSTHLDATLCRPVYPVDNPREWMVGIQLSFIVLGFAIPFPVITGFYLLLARAIASADPAGSGTNSNQERSTSRTIILTYIVVFLVCWLPYHGVLLVDTLALLNLLPFSCRLDSFLFVALHLTQCFSLLHCCVNPIVYNFINRNYRYDLMKAFIFKYSTKTGLAKLIDASRVSETEYLAGSAVDNNV